MKDNEKKIHSGSRGAVKKVNADDRISQLFAEKKALAETLKRNGVELKPVSSENDPVMEWL